jgi:antitoxin ParD1/3/4
MARNTSMLLGDHFDKFIADEIASGRYSSASEVIRTALRLLESDQLNARNINRALVQGEKSGFAKNYSPKAHLKDLRKRLK